MRLITRSDFDGLVCAVLLVEAGIVDEYKFVHPKDVQDGKVTVDKNSLRRLMPNFHSYDVGAVISTIKIREPKNILEKIQHYEYILASFVRKLMSTINTLYVSPGVLSVYRKNIVKRLGGFDEDGNLTEDLDIAMRLKKHHYSVLIEPSSITYTSPPGTFWTLWKQRVRWFRGLIHNSIKHRKMLFNSKYGLFGLFQFPLIMLTQFVLIVSFIMIFLNIWKLVYRKIYSLVLLGSEFFRLGEIPTFKELLYGLNPLILFPLLVALALGLFLLHMAHKNINEKWSYLPVLVFYFFLLPFMTAFHWIWAITLEIFGTKKKWR